MLVLLSSPVPAADPSPSTSSLPEILAQELDLAMGHLSGQPEVPFYISLAIEEHLATRVSASMGALVTSESLPERYLDVDVRVGSPDLDSTHPLRGMGAMRDDSRAALALPIVDVPNHALRVALRRELDGRYRDAAERIGIIRSNRSVKVEEETQAPDFEVREPVVGTADVPRSTMDRAAWEGVVMRVSDVLDKPSFVQESVVGVDFLQVRKHFVDSEGTRIQHGGEWFTLSLVAAATATDGDQVQSNQVLSFRSLDGIPSEAELLGTATEVTERLQALLAAPRGDPYSGPVILTGRAAAVFVHEVIGHRVEGHRQKRDDEGKTFSEYVGRSILPDFISIYDDPTLPVLAGVPLNGWYHFDDEGVAAQRVDLVDHGIFKGFLMSRSPLPDFLRSNGHGRRSTGNAVVSRMGNTILEASRTVPATDLRVMLLAEVRSQNLPYGVLVDEIEGGFTMTGRFLPNAFNVRAISAWRIYADGRPDELVRGIDLVGTPLVAFSNVVAAGDDVAVFNGVCGAESGGVPVSAASPSLLFRRLEFQLKEKGEERPPLLPRPERAEAAGAGRIP